MSLEQLSYLAQILGTVGVVLSLVFVGLQVRQNTAVLYRNEHNSTMTQWTVIRMAIAQNREIAELMTAGLHGDRVLDAADQLRLEQLLQEQVWAGFHIWDRMQRGVFAQGTFELTAGPLLCSLLATTRGAEWWRDAKRAGFLPDYVRDVDAVLARHAVQPGRAGRGLTSCAAALDYPRRLRDGRRHCNSRAVAGGGSHLVKLPIALITAALLANVVPVAGEDIEELELLRQELHSTFTGIDAEILALKTRLQQLEEREQARANEVADPARSLVDRG